MVYLGAKRLSWFPSVVLYPYYLLNITVLFVQIRYGKQIERGRFYTSPIEQAVTCLVKFGKYRINALSIQSNGRG